MPLLYEHYVLGLLREAYGNQIRYQEPGHTGYPDFICYDPLLVIDTKYIPRFKDKTKISSDIIRQLSGYARDRKLFKKCPTEHIPCLVIYPEEGNETNPFLRDGKPIPINELLLEIKKEKSAWGFYRLAVPLPTLR